MIEYGIITSSPERPCLCIMRALNVVDTASLYSINAALLSNTICDGICGALILRRWFQPFQKQISRKSLPIDTTRCRYEVQQYHGARMMGKVFPEGDGRSIYYSIAQSYLPLF